MKRILIIEDHVQEQETLFNRYQKGNVEVDLAKTGMEAFYYLNKFDYNIVVVSNDLHDIDGLWIVKHLKDTNEYELILTSLYNHEYLEKQASGMKIKYLRKPLEKLKKKDE